MELFASTMKEFITMTSMYEESYQSEQRFRLMADNAPVMIWMSGTDKGCTWFNKPWLQFTGRPIEKEIGNGWADNVHKDDFERCLQIYTTSFDARVDFTMEYRLRRHDGEYRWILDNGIPLYGPQEIFAGYIGSCIDITDRKEIEDDLKKLNLELEDRVRERTHELVTSLERERELSEMKSRFVSMASHEFRTPLSAILSSAALVERYGNDELEKRKKHLSRIRSSVQNLNYILNDFLSLDKLEQGRIEVEKSPVDLKELADDVFEEITPIIKEGQTISFYVQGENKIFQDRRILKNVLLNLLSNAAKYSHEGTEIMLTANITADQVVIAVTDHGIGIPEEEQQHLFTKFFRARNAMSIYGTGLGLNIVKKYMELINGSITFRSSPGEGSTFTITFQK